MSAGQIEGIVLQKIDYSETSLIIKMLTENQGVQSFIYQGAKRKNKKGNLISPLAILSVNHYNRGDSDLLKISSVEPAVIYRDIPYNPYKSSIIFFMNEVLNATLKDKEESAELFTFLKSILEILDLSDETANFPIKFLYQLSKFHGFYPQLDKDGLYLDLQEGRYVKYLPNHPFYLSEQKSRLLLTFSGMNFDGVNDPKIDLTTRRELVHDLLNYYKVLFDKFPEIKSLSILEATLHD